MSKLEVITTDKKPLALTKLSYNSDLSNELNQIHNNFTSLKNRLEDMHDRQRARNEFVSKGFEDLHKYTSRVNEILDKYQITIDGIASYLQYTIPAMNLSNRLMQQQLQLEFLLINLEQDKHDTYLDTILSLPWYKRIFYKQRKKIKEEVDKKVIEIYQESISNIEKTMEETAEKLKKLQDEEKEEKIKKI